MFQSYEIELLIPGSEIPKWFSHQSEGTSLNLKGPSDFMGIALCAVFVLRQHHSLPQPPLEIPELSIDFDCEGIGIGHKISCCEGSFFSNEYVKIDSHHLFFRYFSIDRFRDESNKRCSKMDANGFTQVNIRTETEGLEVTKCGARLVYEKDIEDLKQNMAGSSSCSITDYEDDLDDSAKDTKIKRRHDDCDGDGAGPRREEPHPKWIQQPNLTENWIGNFCTQGQGDSNSEEEKFQ